MCRKHYSVQRRAAQSKVRGLPPVDCSVCGREFRRVRRAQVYCSERCSQSASARRYADRREAQGLPRGSAGGFASLLSRVCEVCAADFSTKRSTQVTCSPRCSTVRKRRSKDFRKGHRRRCRHRGLTFEPIDKREVFVRDGWRCGICRRRIHQHLVWPHPGCAVLDHVVPLSVPGSPGHVWGNVQASHHRCNMAKGDRLGRGVQPSLF